MTPRLVTVGSEAVSKRRSRYDGKMLPVQFFVNSESRGCALRHYYLRFTISISVVRTKRHWPFPLEYEDIMYTANVVMSSDDTLRIYGGKLPYLTSDYFWKCRFSNANMASPWNSQSKSISLGAQPEVKRVRPSGPDFTTHARILHNLNCMVSWDLHSIDDEESARIRTFATFSGAREEIHLINNVLRLHGKFIEKSKDWSQVLGPVLDGGPDPWTFELKWRP